MCHPHLPESLDLLSSPHEHLTGLFPSHCHGTCNRHGSSNQKQVCIDVILARIKEKNETQVGTCKQVALFSQKLSYK